MKRISMYITTIQIKKLKDLVIKTGLSMSEHIRRAITEYLGRRNKI